VSTIGITVGGTDQQNDTVQTRKNALLWTAQILLAAFFLLAAMPKLAGQHTAVVMFHQVGAGQWLRYLVGTAELAGAIGLLVPRLAALAAAGLAADMAGASIINVTILHSGAVVMTIPLCIAFALIALARWAQPGNLVTSFRK
jgi:putative oxidoreductase